ncbi:MAG: hypothetical protein HOK67_18675 [Deltaproteobacteria bacterium]|nr:hypothetical protein [Deltaproteobacteria bacterium]MBT4642465.1 hypothetical protein [Deltaproteobacteria bacterium]MBT6501911.1 hypothetical protein [Deltaproteobacteria bacterium]MBT7711344.1 hypothetical protein [Deltaproteobacteria bacterium]
MCRTDIDQVTWHVVQLQFQSLVKQSGGQGDLDAGKIVNGYIICDPLFKLLGIL